MRSSIPIHDSITKVGISAIAVHQPPLQLPNAWYESIIAKKFVKHTGITSRTIAQQTEVELGCQAIRNLQQETQCNLADCAGLVFVSPSLVPMAVANRYLTREQARLEQPNRLALELSQQADLQPRKSIGINGFCSGYAKAFELVKQRLIPYLNLAAEEFVVVVTASRISRITDFSCSQSGALFGDYATATLLTRSDSQRNPIHFELIDAKYEKVATNRPYFDFHQREQVMVPTGDGGKNYEDRVVFSLDGMGIADTAPRAMAAAANDLVRANQLAPEDIDCIVPHQAGTGIVRLTAMKLEEKGFKAAPINGLTETTGNISSCSVPNALYANWNKLSGSIICPVAAVGAPGKPHVSQGCILLQSTASRRAVAA